MFIVLRFPFVAVAAAAFNLFVQVLVLVKDVACRISRPSCRIATRCMALEYGGGGDGGVRSMRGRFGDFAAQY